MSVLVVRFGESVSDLFMLDIRENGIPGDINGGLALLEERQELSRKVQEDPSNLDNWKRLLANCKRLYATYPNRVYKIFRRAMAVSQRLELDDIGKKKRVEICLELADLGDDIPRKRDILRHTFYIGIAQNQPSFFEYYARFEIAQSKS